MLLKCCTQDPNKFEKFSSGHRTGKGQLPFQSSKKGNPKECSNYRTIALISHASKVMLKILQATLLQYVNREHVDVFLELFCFFNDPVDVDSLISGSSAF